MKTLLSVFSFLLGGCGTCQEVTLSAEERAWFATYTEGTRLTFRSNQGRTATATVLPRQEWHENTNCNKLEAGPYQPIFSQLVLRPALPYDAQHRDFVVNIRKHKPGRAGWLTLNVAGLEGDSAALAGGPLARLVRQSCTLSTTGKTYPAAYVFRQGQNATQRGTGPVRAFFWDKHDGLIRYELAGGEIFELAAQ
ncbi:hypothetical protein [Hymenobacter chitinivorans]|uniref:Lipoprotein n=1 Tax=Hymenobacter chitinivorans DSM 11115 TaxID=1121954 RepID=A0A2M9BPG9_9BACT|nr:hypothetical protein [Hymenobacter chitinivorans]PJJ59861.1 hypothetical protein CLV45_1283 [Hymenobacter chitinivorans DSM 11115]